MTGPTTGEQADQGLLLRETIHRSANDLQLVVSLLSLQSQRAPTAEARQALTDAMARVGVLARARSELGRERQSDLGTALRQVCEALGSQAEPRSILISVRAGQELAGLSSSQISTLALVVNELATNAIKHAFEEGKAGRISIETDRTGEREVTVIVDDDGLPFPELKRGDGGLRLGLAKRLVASIGGLLIMPEPGTKRFEIRATAAGG